MPEASHVEATKRPRIRFSINQTRLYEMVEAIVNEVDGEDEKLVPKIVVYLMNSERIKLVRQRKSLVVA